ncbi:hypothetical protein [Bacteroides sp. 519]|uniref:hypothetical protein n=1 Tax=Bacteroides sp. 519 TaxID=2302937 RepID=UPI0013D1A21C|nr:hypothetical protein [Bacteroides sp. 519]NDV58736.1 hypothetical protein [Bacteroides sp. 519]
MYTFLFDMQPNTGNVRITLKLATMLYEMGHEVYYTDTSDSVFTSGLLDKGIGRVYYPNDLHWFSPHMVLLDYGLKEKATFYQQQGIKYIFIDAHLLNSAPQHKTDVPVMYLPPSDDETPLLHNPDDAMMDWLSTIKKDKNNILIIGLLEEGMPPQKLDRFYEVIKKSCINNKQYKVMLLSNNEQNTAQLSLLPDNMTLYRFMNLSPILPMCDIALISGDLNTMFEGIKAQLPALVYPAKDEYNFRISQYVNHGLGIYSEVKKVTPKMFEQQINRMMQNKIDMYEKLQKTQDAFNDENEQLKQKIAYFIKDMEENLRMEGANWSYRS